MKVNLIRKLLFLFQARFKASSFPGENIHEYPLLASLFSISHLEKHGEAMARIQKVDIRPGKDKLLSRLRENETILAEIYELLTAGEQAKISMTPAEVWFLDNFYLVKEQTQIARQHLPKSYSRQLPCLVNGATKGLPRVYSIIKELIIHVDGLVDEGNLSSIVSSYQKVTPLKLGELWAIPIMLRLAMIDNIRTIAMRINASRKERNLANFWADRILETALNAPKNIILDMADLSRSKVAMTNSFVAALVKRLQHQNPVIVLPLTWLEQNLAEQGQTIELQVQLDNQHQAINQISIRNSITSLRFLTSVNWKNFVEKMSRVEHILKEDPAGVYQKMNFSTRDSYRHVIEKIARQSRHSEESVASTAVKLAKQNRGNHSRKDHVGYYLIEKKVVLLEKAVQMRLSIKDLFIKLGNKVPLLYYLGFIFLITGGLTALILFFINPLCSHNWIFWSLLLCLGFSQLAIALVNWAASILVLPRLLPRMDFKKGIPPQSCTLITVPAMLFSLETISELLNKMEACYLANQTENLYFSLLTDFKDALHEFMPDDNELLDTVRKGIRELNEKYSHHDYQPFLFFHRQRQWNPQEKLWMGYERKRGKLDSLNRALREEKTSELLMEGNPLILPQIKYIITLDTDTQLSNGAARQLIETISHPLNTPIYDSAKQRVVGGYTILQPMIVSRVSTGQVSWYSRIFGGDTGIDPYTRAISDLYQDLFKEGSFIGKGIYDVDMFNHVLSDRLPENRILSHDLLEGIYCRAGLVSDIQLIDEFPESYNEDIARRHRWVRGDWQIAAWLLPFVPGFKQKLLKNPISLLSWWKIFDNLRRSVVPIGLVMLIALSWFFLQPAWLGFVIAAGIIFIPILPGFLQEACRIPRGYPYLLHIQTLFGFLGRQLFRAFFMLIQLPYEAISNLDAIMRTCWRIIFSRRKLLEWITSGEARRITCKNCWKYYRMMLMIPMLTIILLLLLFMAGKQGVLNASILLGLWFFSPIVTWLFSKPRSQHIKSLTGKQIDFLRKISRKTWRFFETFFTSEDNWLPPDNFQEEPIVVLAHRTSPTNIGIMLLSNLGAYDLGYISCAQLLDRIKKTFKTLNGLEKYRGHFFNWYDTRTLLPLPPHYISAVDSGNLAGYLLTLKCGLLEIKDQNIFQERIFSGLQDILLSLIDLLEPSLDKISRLLKKKSLLATHLKNLINTIKELQIHSAGLSQTLRNISCIASIAGELRAQVDKKNNPQADWWFQAFADQCTAQEENLLFVAPWLATLEQESASLINKDLYQVLDNNQTLVAIGELHSFLPRLATEIKKLNMAKQEDQQPVREIYTKLEQQVKLGINRANGWMIQMEQMTLQCQSMADMDYEFLYDTQRHLLSIGYNVSSHKRDESFYDLLASEARLCSFIGIAQGKLPLEHWFALGRLVTIWKGKVILLSWGGSMFEYLMPQLVMPSYADTLLGQTCEAIVERQISYGNKRNVPWGISESAENFTDAKLNYQYRSFGIPDLGFKRGLAKDLVIAPYASILALMIKPAESCINMQKLSEREFEGVYGFYEAIDYTPSRLAHGQNEALIRSFMTHHQGMSFISLVNYFTNNIMSKRFEADPLFQTAVLLLQERVPKVAPFLLQSTELFRTKANPEGQEDLLRIFNTPQTPFPEVHLLSNGYYHVMLTNAGGGYSRWRDISVTRWNADPTKDNYGTFIYIKDISSDSLWSAAYQPTLAKPKNYEAIFLQSRAEFRRRDHGLDTYTEIAVSPEDDIENRRISLSNFTLKTRIIELTSYAEVVLIAPAAEASHPAFTNLFMQTRIVKSHQAILCSRRPRSSSEKNPWMFHLLVVNETERFEISYETDRLKFNGRNRTAKNPQALDDDGALSGTEGSVLDPIVSIRCRLTLKPGETVTVGFISGMAETEQKAMNLIEKYHDRRLADRVFEIALIHGKVVLLQLGVTEKDAQLFGRLASSILYSSQYRRANPSILMKNRRGQSSLWAYSISGDLPIILLKISDPTRIELVAQLIQAHAYWRLKGIQVDLVILNEDRSGYRQLLNDLIIGLINDRNESGTFDKKGGIFLRYSEQISEEDRILIETAARAIITDNNGALSEQISHYPRSNNDIQKLIAIYENKQTAGVENFKQDNLLFFNGWGGFTQDGREYVIQIKPADPTPLPWVNIVANSQLGTAISQSGGYTWFENAHEFRLTPWYNDPVTDNSGEALYIRDEISGTFWSPLPLPAPGRSDYLNRQGFGYSVFEYNTWEIKSELWIFVDKEAPVKYWLLKVRNDDATIRRLSATIFLELVLGEIRSKTEMYIKTEIDMLTGALFAVNPYNTDFSGKVMFLDVNEKRQSFTGDRTEFIGRNGELSDPAAMHCENLSGKVGGGYDPALAIQVYFELEPGQDKEIVFILGVGNDVADARSLALKQGGSLAAHQALEKVWEFWKHTLGAINVATPDIALNMITNGWLVYQTMSARLWARSAFYQSGGAFGFRDQLQDVMALVHTKPELIREHLILSASRQFREGDVQHWWHPPHGRGVRTRISDDYLWLPLITANYVSSTGDRGVLNVPVTFLEGRSLYQNEDSYYDLPVTSEEKLSLYEHCKIAIKHAFYFGQHGLPLMGSGDWNDGMNLVGVEGKGESIWLAFFLYHVLQKFIPIAKMFNDESFALLCTEKMLILKENIDNHAWDGNWYRRAFFDNGTPLGSSLNEECQMDAIAQSWSVLSGAGDKVKSRQAMRSLEERLINGDNGLILLLNPPFDKSSMEPGYIKGYVPGVRENGGQYTHAAIWTVMAFAMMGDNEKVKALLTMINPVNHGSTREKSEIYKVEPYVLAADIYAVEPHMGRGGWTWYTGSAAWMYRLIIESVLGLDLQIDKLYFNPCLPSDWDHFNVHYRFRETVYHFAYHQHKQDKKISIIVDGVIEPDCALILRDDRIEHFVDVNIGIKIEEKSQ